MPFARLAFASFLIAVSTSSAFPQTSDAAPGHVDPYSHDPYITGTGATVANPGRSQSGGTTPEDLGIRRRDNAIDRSICKGC